MKKQKYVSPEMEIMEIKTQCILASSTEAGGAGSGFPPGFGPKSSSSDDEE